MSSQVFDGGGGLTFWSWLAKFLYTTVTSVIPIYMGWFGFLGIVPFSLPFSVQRAAPHYGGLSSLPGRDIEPRRGWRIPWVFAKCAWMFARRAWYVFAGADA